MLTALLPEVGAHLFNEALYLFMLHPVCLRATGRFSGSHMPFLHEQHAVSLLVTRRFSVSNTPFLRETRYYTITLLHCFIYSHRYYKLSYI